MKRIIFERTTDVKMPCKAHKTDAGLDFYIPNETLLTVSRSAFALKE